VSTIFGDIKDASQTEDLVLDCLNDWLPVYLREFELQRAIAADSFPHPKSFLRVNELDKFPEDQLPVILTISPGLADEPVQEGDGGRLIMPWDISVAVEIMARERMETGRFCRQYTAVIMAILMQQSGHYCGAVDLIDVRFDDLPVEDERTIGVGVVQITAWVEDSLMRWAGPSPPPDPDTQPGSQWPGVATTVVDVEPKQD